MSNTRDAWAQVGGAMEVDIALVCQRLGIPGMTGPIVMAVRSSLYFHIATETYTRQDMTPEIKNVIIETVTG